jgi:hypothetical protein
MSFFQDHISWYEQDAEIKMCIMITDHLKIYSVQKMYFFLFFTVHKTTKWKCLRKKFQGWYEVKTQYTCNIHTYCNELQVT